MLEIWGAWPPDYAYGQTCPDHSA